MICMEIRKERAQRYEKKTETTEGTRPKKKQP